MNAIEFNNISKQYRLGQISTGTVSHDLNRWWARFRGKEDPYLQIGEINDRSHKGTSDYVWALQDINFSVEQGDVVGIIGKNGAGKSTLLKILSKITAPTTGEIRARGRIASLLEVGTGFHPEMTGRENIYLNGSIMGMTRSEITRKLDEIVDFAGVERYLDTPVKRYSSGMMVRLGFAVAAHLEPEILIVDEVLAVGDAEFQKKAIGKMQEVSRGEGRTVLFVSHNMSAVRSLCKKGIVLSNGRCEKYGLVEDAIRYYLENSVISRNFELRQHIQIQNAGLEVKSISINGKSDWIIDIDREHHEFEITICGFLKGKKRMALEVRFFDVIGLPVAFFSGGHTYGEIHEYEGEFMFSERIKIPHNLTKGCFNGYIALTYPGFETYFETDRSIQLNVEGLILYTGHVFEYENAGLIVLEKA